MSRPFVPGGPQRFKHQRHGLREILRLGGVAALVFDPGTGKTATTIDYMSILAHGLGREEVRVLVICPLAAVSSWTKQMPRWVSSGLGYWAEALGGSILQRAEALASRGGNPFPRQLSRGKRVKAGTGPRSLHHGLSWSWTAGPGKHELSAGPDDVPGPRIVLEVVNLETFASRRAHGSRTYADIMLDAVRRYGPDLVVVDESHKIKSASGNASRLLARITPHVPRRLILTGTLMPHGMLDVFGQWRFLAPTDFGEMGADGRRSPATFGRFKGRYARMGGYLGREVVGYQNVDEFQDILAQRAIVVKKADALDLPPTQDVEVSVQLSEREQRAYAEMKRTLAADLGDGSMVTVESRLTQMMRLRQITSGHVPDDAGQVQEIGDSKIRTVRSLVHDSLAGESRVVVFGQLKPEIRRIAEALRQKGTEVMLIDGDTDKEERLRMRERFGSDDPARIVLVAQIQTMSLSVNELVTSCHAVFASQSLQRDEYVQARDRLDRIGQTRPVTFWHVNAPGTVDDVILRSHRDRTDLENAVLRHILGTEEEEGEEPKE